MSSTRLPTHPPRAHRPPHGLPRLLVAVLVLQLGLPACADPVQLVPGAALERTIDANEAHSYPVRLSAGDFLRVTVDQEAVDVEVKLLGPDGKPAAFVDGPGPASDYGTEDLAAVAATSGLYEIMVHATMKNAPQPRYRVRMEAPRPAGEADSRRVAAVRANQEATNGMASDPQLPLPRQAELREKARRIWHDLGETHREADTLLQLGIVRFRLGQVDQASPLLHRAAALYEKLGDRVGQAKALNEAGRTCERSGHTDEALREYRQAAELARQAGAHWPRVNALTNVGTLLDKTQGKPREAITILTDALDLAKSLQCAGCQAPTLVNLGSAHESLSETQKAIGFYKQALTVPSITAEDAGGALNNLGLAYLSLGDPEEALATFKKAKAQSPKASTLSNEGLALESLSRIDEALDSYRQAAELAQKTSDLRAQAYALNNLGFLDLKVGKREEALAAWKGMRELVAGHSDLEPLVAFNQGAANREMGNLDAAARDLERSRALASARGDLGWKAVSAWALAGVEKDRGRYDAAIVQIKAAVDIIESLRNQVLNPELRALFLGSNQKYYELYVDTLMERHSHQPQAGWDARALQVSERARARSLLDLLGEFRADLRTGVDPKLLASESDLRAEVNARDLRHLQLIHQNASSGAIAKAAAERNESLSRLNEVEAELRQTSRGYAALTQPQPLDAAAIQSQVLGDGALLLEYSLGEKKSYLWAVSPAAVKSFVLPGREQIEKAALDFYSKVSRQDADRAQTDTAARGLSRIILGPVEALLAADETLLVVSDGVLQYIPFSALPLPSSPAERLLARHRVVNLPSASTLAVLRQELAGRAPAPKTLAVLADPVFRADDSRVARGRGARSAQPDALAIKRGDAGADPLSLPRLRWSKEEADTIAAMVPRPDQKLEAVDFAASVDTARSGRLAEYRYVHFATHGFLDTSHPELSRLVLSQLDRNGRPQDGSLRLQDIYNLQLNADLVVLSACQTALGKAVRGEGLLGLTRGFMYAGSARVLASLWSVEDRATSKLMVKLYHYLLAENLSPAESLRRAQLDLAAEPRFASPYYWAGFSLQGEWQ